MLFNLNNGFKINNILKKWNIWKKNCEIAII